MTLIEKIIQRERETDFENDSGKDREKLCERESERQRN